MDYLRLLIKRGVNEGGAYSENMAYEDEFDTKEEYGLWIKHAPFTILPQIKSPVSQTWNDEDGDDVFLPTTGAKCEAYDWEVEFVYLENDGEANVKIANFVNRIKGRWLEIKDEYTQMTRTGVYVSEFDKEPKFKRRGNRDLVIFKVKFRVNNPNLKEDF